MHTILSIGTMYVDVNAAAFPYGDGLKPGNEVVGSGYELAAGGSALNFARFSSALGLKPVFVGKCGTDAMGSVLAQLVQAAGVAPAFVQDPTVQTNIGINFLGSDGSSIMTVVGSANQSLHSDDVIQTFKKWVSQIKYVYLGGCFKLKALLPAYTAIVKLAKENKVAVILDHGRVTNATTPQDIAAMQELAQQADYYLPSKEEFCELWGVNSIEDGLQKKVTNAVTVVKDAENGAWYFQDGFVKQVTSFAVTVVNSVGAGDSFNAGFIAALELGQNIPDAIKFACATAAIKISQTQIPIKDKVEKLLNG